MDSGNKIEKKKIKPPPQQDRNPIPGMLLYEDRKGTLKNSPSENPNCSRFNQNQKVPAARLRIPFAKSCAVYRFYQRDFSERTPWRILWA